MVATPTRSSLDFTRFGIEISGYLVLVFLTAVSAEGRIKKATKSAAPKPYCTSHGYLHSQHQTKQAFSYMQGMLHFSFQPICLCIIKVENISLCANPLPE